MSDEDQNIDMGAGSGYGRRRPRGIFFAVFCGACLIIFFTAIAFLNTPPMTFVPPVTVEIASGMSLQGATRHLKESGIIRSSTLLQFAVHLFFDNAPVRAGVYELSRTYSTFELAEILTSGKEGSPFVRLTVPEGLRIGQIDGLLVELLPTVEPGDFVRAAAGQEGYLFPDTYFLSEMFDASSTVAAMRMNFDEKIEPLLPDIEASGRTLNEIVVMASIIEKEANDPVSKGLVAGILWDRIDIGMPLQVDAPFEYALGKPNSELRPEDLDTDTPYNTYLYRGFPPTAIGNPGLDALHAAIHPTPSPYLYYITGADGNFYYAETFDAHKQNIHRYLR